MVTLKDISKECGVSIATVSKALNGQSDIGGETAQIIKDAAKQMGYLPNSAARALKTNRSHNIGVLFIDKTSSGLKHEYFSVILNSLKDEAERLGYDITFISKNIGNFSMDYYEHSKYRNCDGVVIASVDFDDVDILRLVESELPTVTLDHVFDDKTSILSDNIGGMVEIVNYIYKRGHRKIAIIHGENTDVTRKRLTSFKKTCERLDVDVPDEYVKQGAYHDPKSAALATRELLALANRPTCIVYPDDFSFIGGMNEIEKQGLSIPDDISVVGYDGILLSQVLRPRLTTYKQNAEVMGREAARKLIEEIEEQKTYIPQQVMVSGRLLEGDTVKQL